MTGASSGFGEQMARSLAAEHAGLVLVARNRNQLEALADEIRKGSASDVEVLRADLTDCADLLLVEQRLASIDQPIDLLVNNAGGMHLSVFPDGSEGELIRLMVVAVVRLTAAVLPVMRRRYCGSIVNMSSGAAFHPHPWRLEAIIEPVLLAFKTDEYARQLSVARDHDLLGRGEP
jgi:short-subunit dehydrogenase